jgi:hypothetical protein
VATQGLAAGQYAVFYQNGICFGCGMILPRQRRKQQPSLETADARDAQQNNKRSGSPEIEKAMQVSALGEIDDHVVTE